MTQLFGEKIRLEVEIYAIYLQCDIYLKIPFSFKYNNYIMFSVQESSYVIEQISNKRPKLYLPAEK